MPQAPAVEVEGLSRIANPYGLFSQITFRQVRDADGGEHWYNGVEWQAVSCDAVSGIAVPGCNVEDVDGLPKSFTAGIPMGDALGFTVYGSAVCAPVANSVAEAQARATTRLLVREEARVERALWTGDLGNTPSLAGSTVVTPSPGTAVDPVQAIALLENWLAANYGSLGVIHMTRGMAVAAIAAWAVVASGSGLKTVVGTPVVAGAGYPGSSPAGAAAAAGESWIYASPPLFGYRSDVFDSSNRAGDLMDRANNDLYAVAERNYLLGFDPCGTAAVEATMACCSNS